jgi:hypothetical protein
LSQLSLQFGVSLSRRLLAALRPEDLDFQDADPGLLRVVGGMVWEYWLEDDDKFAGVLV